jgi:hypothetical protein
VQARARVSIARRKYSRTTYLHLAGHAWLYRSDFMAALESPKTAFTHEGGGSSPRASWGIQTTTEKSDVVRVISYCGMGLYAPLSDIHRPHPMPTRAHPVRGLLPAVQRACTAHMSCTGVHRVQKQGRGGALRHGWGGTWICASPQITNLSQGRQLGIELTVKWIN